MMCDASACLAHLGAGRWDGRVWRWEESVPACCGFGQVGPARAAELLRGRSLVFLGDSQSRRHLWAVVDAVGGAARAIRRTRGSVVADSHYEFDAAAISLNDTLYDSQRAYHAGQTVLLNVDTGRWTLLDPGQLCGVDRREWMTDHRLIGALKRGHPPPYDRMRGALYRLRLELLVSPGFANATGPVNRPSARAPRRRASMRATDVAERLRRKVEALARDKMSDWGCQKPRVQDCSFDGALQRNCARRLSVAVDMDKRPTGPLVGPTAFHLTLSMGEMGGTCARAAHLLERRLTAALSPSSGHSGGHSGRRSAGASGRRLHAFGAGERRAGVHGASARARLTGVPASGGGRSPLPSVATADVDTAQVVIQRPIAVDPVCQSYCRKTHRLECPPSAPPYADAVRMAARAHADSFASGGAKGAAGDNGGAPGGGGGGGSWRGLEGLRESSSGQPRRSLAVLTFLYAATLETDMTETLEQWNAHSYGYGADLIVMGATWQSVMRTRPRAAPLGGGLLARYAAATTRSGTNHSHDGAGASAAVELSWDARLDAAWGRALSACGLAARCVLRTVPETPRQLAPSVYHDFARHVRPLAANASVGLIDSFSGTWGGVRAGVMAHHDSTRIHFSDTGRAFLAQLTLNAIPHLLPAGTPEALRGRHGRHAPPSGASDGTSTAAMGAVPPTAHEGEVRLGELTPEGTPPGRGGQRALRLRSAARRGRQPSSAGGRRR